MDRKKTALIDALSRYGGALCRLYQAKLENEESKPTLEEIDNVLVELLRFSDINDKVTGYFAVWHACVHKHYGRMLKVLCKLLEEKSCKDMEEAAIWATQQLSWDHVANHWSSTLGVRYPSAYRLF